MECFFKPDIITQSSPSFQEGSNPKDSVSILRRKVMDPEVYATLSTITVSGKASASIIIPLGSPFLQTYIIVPISNFGLNYSSTGTIIKSGTEN